MDSMPKKLLLVDDEASLVQLLKLTLEFSGEYKCSVAFSGEECLDAVKESRPDLIIIDLMMPGIGGLEALKRVKTAEAGLPVLIMSAIEDEEKIREALAAGAAGWMIKPVELDALKTKLDSILQN